MESHNISVETSNARDTCARIGESVVGDFD